MSQTIRVRDEDAELIETVGSMTGLNKPETAHYLIRGLNAGDRDRMIHFTEEALDEYLARVYPDVQGPDDVTDTLREEASLNSAEELFRASRRI
jgi:hypothetical protein